MRIVERVADTAENQFAAENIRSELAQRAESEGVSARYGVLNIRSVDERIRPRTTNPWIIIERKVEW